MLSTDDHWGGVMVRVKQLAEKCKGWSKKCQGTALAVPQAGKKNRGL
jgi:hypothetical protein